MVNKSVVRRLDERKLIYIIIVTLCAVMLIMWSATTLGTNDLNEATTVVKDLKLMDHGARMQNSKQESVQCQKDLSDTFNNAEALCHIGAQIHSRKSTMTDNTDEASVEMTRFTTHFLQATQKTVGTKRKRRQVLKCQCASCPHKHARTTFTCSGCCIPVHESCFHNHHTMNGCSCK
eukprot:770867_1